MSWVVYFYARVLLGLALFAFGLVVAFKYWDKVGKRCLLAFYAMRLIIMFGMIVVLKAVPSDLGMWVDHILWIKQGYVPGLDFLSIYFLGFEYMFAGVYSVGNSPYSVAVLLSIAELIGLGCFFALVEKVCSTKIAKQSVILYVLSPFCLIASMLSAQDETLILCGVAAYAYYALAKPSIVGRIMTLALTIVLTKLTIVFYLIPVASLKRYKGVFCCIGLFALYCVLVKLMGANPFNLSQSDHLGLEAAHSTTANLTVFGNIWYCFGTAIGDASRPIVVPEVVAYGVFAITAALFAFPLVPSFFNKKSDVSVRLDAFSLMLFGWLILLMLFTKAIYSPYFIPAIPFALYLVVKDRERGGKTTLPLMLAWLLVMAYKDVIHHGSAALGVENNALFLHCCNYVCVISTLAMMVAIVVSYRGLFYRPATVYSTLFRKDDD